MPPPPTAERFPDHVEELLGFLLRHLASELARDECPAPLAESLRVYTRAVIAATRDEHEHLTPVVEVDACYPGGDPARRECPRAYVGEDAGSDVGVTLPTEPPVSYEDRPPRRRSLTARGGWRVE